MKKEVYAIGVLAVLLAIGFFAQHAQHQCAITNSTPVELDYVIGYPTQNGVAVAGTSMENVARYSGVWNPFMVYKPLKGTLDNLTLPEPIKEALIGKKQGDTITGVVPAGSGFPEKNESLVLKLQTSRLPREPRIGETVTLGNSTGIVVMENSNVTFVDFNPPYAGKPMLYKVEVRSVLCR